MGQHRKGLHRRPKTYRQSNIKTLKGKGTHNLRWGKDYFPEYEWDHYAERRNAFDDEEYSG